MASELLLRVLLANAFAIVLMLLLRRPLCRWCGAAAAYAAWALVPASMLAAVLPHGAGPVRLAADLPALPAALQAAQAGAISVARPWSSWIGALWLAGVLAMAAGLAWQQWRYLRQLRCAPAASGARVRRSGAAGSGPVLVGVWRPAVVLPADFRHSYSKAERRLVLDHERIHARRGDLWANAACAALQCLAWCNPLVHMAAARFRLDQELACDETVLRRNGQAATYARALLKTQLSAQGIPLACQWQANHPLKERIVNLKSTVSPTRRKAGQLAAGLLMAACSVAAWAAQAGAASDKYYFVNLNMQGSSPTVLVKSGDTAEIAMGKGADEWRTRMVVTPQGEQVQVRALVTHGGKQVDDYTVVGALGQDMFIGSPQAPEFRATLRVREKTGQ
ncbi:M56 family metallopeptidase [Pseudoduganella sp.]|uniref:M56 family metallopeptidase n=1 Tax=Pseudoduganella sp. TaxID=1880898 RepID=UPI0035B1614A